MNTQDKDDLIGTLILIVASILIIALAALSYQGGEWLHKVIDDRAQLRITTQLWCDAHYCKNDTNIERCSAYSFHEEYNCTNSPFAKNMTAIRLG